MPKIAKIHKNRWRKFGIINTDYKSAKAMNCFGETMP